MSQDTLRATEVAQGAKWLTDAAYDMGRQSPPTQATQQAYTTEKGIPVAVRGELNVSAGGAAGVHTLDIVVPAGAYLQDVIVIPEVLWNSGTSNTLIVGDTADPNGYFAAVDLKATDLLVGECLSAMDDGAWGGKGGAYLTTAGVRGAAATNFGQYLKAGTTITAELTNVGTAATTGVTHLVVVYTVPLNGGVATFVAA